jgi:hypothetical protein
MPVQNTCVVKHSHGGVADYRDDNRENELSA